MLGTMSTCTGACGLMSRKAVTRSSWCTMVAGISPAMIFSKIVAMAKNTARRDDFVWLQAGISPIIAFH